MRPGELSAALSLSLEAEAMRTFSGLAAIVILSACAQVPSPSLSAGLAESVSDATVFSVPPGDRVNIFTGASAETVRDAPPRDWPTFRVCRAADSEGDVTLAIGPLDQLGPSHPAIQRLDVAPGKCHFVSGPIIEAVGAPVEFSALVLSDTGGGDRTAPEAALLVTLVSAKAAE